MDHFDIMFGEKEWWSRAQVIAHHFSFKNLFAQTEISTIFATLFGQGMPGKDIKIKCNKYLCQLLTNS